jgi:hypothetical protein
VNHAEMSKKAEILQHLAAHAVNVDKVKQMASILDGLAEVSHKTSSDRVILENSSFFLRVFVVNFSCRCVAIQIPAKLII